MKLSVEEVLYKIQITGKNSLFEICVLHIPKPLKSQTLDMSEIILNYKGEKQ